MINGGDKNIKGPVLCAVGCNLCLLHGPKGYNLSAYLLEVSEL